ncbi:hypothetical protein QR680_015857 [Steinernema hermaphroditum]|uniref:CUB domain-containing protein n=1 Tax=Steinernema hermaphroditum TaxID=289476 RepID=A0AA39LLL3_9BILA|nr:hypothetical protein QR680_015857 [Steinernema hermaphroditum]
MDEIDQLTRERDEILAEINRLETAPSDHVNADDEMAPLNSVEKRLIPQLAVFPGFVDIFLFSCVPKDTFRYILPLLSKCSMTLSELNERFARKCDYYDQINSLNAYFGDRAFMDLPDVWIGFEAIVAAFDDEHVTCPFQTGSVPAVVTKDSPVLIAPSLDDTTDLASCLWNLIPDDNHVLKIFFPIIQLHNDFELFEVDIDNKEGYSASGPGNAVLPTGPYYANSSIRVKFVYKKDTGPGMHDINFFGVVSAFPKNEQAVEEPYCPSNATLTLDNPDTTYTIRNNEPIRTMSYITPYHNSQHCRWNLQPGPAQELRVYPVVSDFEQYCDTAYLWRRPTIFTPQQITISDPNSYVNTSVWPVLQNGIVIIESTTDGNYGRYGFELEAHVIECTCGPKQISLTNAQKTGTIGFGKASPYCSQLVCDWQISSPSQSFIMLKQEGHLRGCKTNNSLGDSFDIADSQTGEILLTISDCDSHLLKERSFSTNNLTVRFRSSEGVAETVDQDTSFQLTATLVKSDVVDNLILIDGELNSVSSTTPVSSLSPKLMVNESPPFVSKTGTITIGRVGPKLSVLLYAPAQILIKVYDESRDLTDTQALIGSTPYTNINKIMCPSKLNLDYCVFLLGAANLRFPLTIGSYPEVRLFITDLDGTEQKVKVIAGLDTTRVPFFEFNKTSMSLWNNTVLYGNVFSVLVPKGGALTLAPYNDPPMYDRFFVENQKNGVFMSPSYPFGGVRSSFSESIQVFTTAEGKCLDVKMEMVVEKLSPNSKVEIYSDSKIYATAPVNGSYSKSFVINGTNNITLKCDLQSESHGFFIRYEGSNLKNTPSKTESA